MAATPIGMSNISESPVVRTSYGATPSSAWIEHATPTATMARPRSRTATRRVVEASGGMITGTDRRYAVTSSCPSSTRRRTSAIAASRPVRWRSSAPAGVRNTNVTRTTASPVAWATARAYAAPWSR